jgi:hypothetical protein
LACPKRCCHHLFSLADHRDTSVAGDAFLLIWDLLFAKFGLRGKERVTSERLYDNVSWMLLLWVVLTKREVTLGPNVTDGYMLSWRLVCKLRRKQ